MEYDLKNEHGLTRKPGIEYDISQREYARYFIPQTKRAT